MKLDLTLIDLDRRVHRLELDPKQIESLADDLSRPHGQLQPIVVREKEDGRYALIAGRRRCAAATLLGWTHIEAKVIVAPEGDNIPALAENLKRAQLSPLEEALQVRALHIDDGLSLREIAERTGHGHSWVQDRLALAELPELFRDAVHKRALSISGALLLSQITDAEYAAYLVHIAHTNGATVHQCQAWLQEWSARVAMIAAPDGALSVPQLPPAPPPSAQTCFFCRTPVELGAVIMVRSCAPCIQELHAVAEQQAQAEKNGHAFPLEPPRE